MAVVRRGRSGDSVTAEWKKDKIVQRYAQTVVVELDRDPAIDDPDPISAAEILGIPGVPRPGYTTYSPRPGVVVPFAICKTVKPQADPKSRRLWRVDCTYELSGSEQGSPQSDTLDPSDLAPKIEPFTTDIEIPLLSDFDDKPIVDPFDQLLDTPVMATIALPGILVTRYVESFDENTLAGWKHTTNESPWRGQPADTWCVQNCTGKTVQFGAFTIGQLQFNISANSIELQIDGTATRVGWMDARALVSPRYKDDAGVVNEFRVDGTSLMPQWIDKDGKKSSTPQFAAWRNRRKRDFNLIVAGA